MNVKKVSACLLAIGLCSAPVLAQANGLTIVNNTNSDSTAIINGGICSSTLPGGVTKAHTTNSVSSIVINMACMGHSSDCKADVYMTNNCSGDKAASIMFDTKKGIYGINSDSKDYQFLGSAFDIQIFGGPA